MTLEEVIKEMTRRLSDKPPEFFDGKFKLQEDFIKHPAKFKALQATRRFGKSYCAGLYLVKEAYEIPNCSCVYLALTRDSAKRILWKDVLKNIDTKYKLNMKFNETLLSATLPNGSIIYIMGADSDESEREKLLGQRFKVAVIDEAASFTIDLRDLVYRILKPAMADYRGTICMIGTPGNITKGLYFDITNGVEPGWYVVKGDTRDNPYMKVAWEAEIDDLKANQPYITETAAFKQMYLNQWVVDSEKLVYKFTESKNTYTTLPLHAKGTFTYVLGVDLGYDDASAFVVAGYHPHDKTLYIIESWKRTKMDITDVANAIRQMKSKYEIVKVVIDGANKQAVEEIQKRHLIPLVPADKTGKCDFIEIMNSEFIMARIKLNVLYNQDYIKELNTLIWDDKSLKRQEHPNCENHICDAALYAWRFTYQYYSEKPFQMPKYGTQEWDNYEVKRMEDEAIEYFEEQNRQSDTNDTF